MLSIGTWNCRSIKDDPRRTAATNYMMESKCLVTAIQETHHSPNSPLTTDTSRYQLILNPRSSNEPGLGFFIRKNRFLRIIDVEWPAANIGVCSLEFRGVEAKFVNIYAPTVKEKSETDSKTFFDRLSRIYWGLKKGFNGPIIIGGDSNAAIEGNSDDFSPWILKHLRGDENKHGWILQNFLARNRLFHLNSRFPAGNKNRWTHNGPTGCSEIDIFMSDRIDIVEAVSTFSHEDNMSDHRMVRSRWIMRTSAERSRTFACRRKPKLHPRDLTDFDKKASNLIPLANLKNYRCFVKELVEAADEAPKRREEKFSEATRAIKKLRWEELQRPIIDYDKVKALSRELRHSMQADLDAKRKTLIEKCASRKSTKQLKRAIPREIPLNSLQRLDGTVTTNRREICDMVQVHFNSLYSDSSNNRAPPLNKQSVKRTLPILHSEVRAEINRLKTKSAPGIDMVVPEMLKKGGEPIVSALTNIYNDVIKEASTPLDWKTSSIKLLPKKPNAKTIKEYRPIALLPIIGKIFSSIITKRITPHLEAYLEDTQCGFRKSRGCTDQIQSVAVLMEKCHEFNLPLSCLFVDYSTAFDKVRHTSVLNSLKNANIPPPLINTVALLMENGTASIMVHEEEVKIDLQTGVRQGDCSSPALFSAALQTILDECDEVYSGEGIEIDGKMIRRLEFADDVVLFSTNKADLERRLQTLDRVSAKHGLKINVSKTVLLSNALGVQEIMHNGQTIKAEDGCRYLGRWISSNGGLDTEITRRIRSSWAAFHAVKEVFEALDNKGKVQLFLQNIIPALLYASETWSLTKQCVNKIQSTVNSLTAAAKIRNWKLDCSKFLIQKKLRWAGHVVRREPSRWTKIVTEWQPRTGRRNRGRPRKRWSDDVRDALKIHVDQLARAGTVVNNRRRAGILVSPELWSTYAQNRHKWIEFVRSVQNNLPA